MADGAPRPTRFVAAAMGLLATLGLALVTLGGYHLGKPTFACYVFLERNVGEPALCSRGPLQTWGLIGCGGVAVAGCVASLWAVRRTLPWWITAYAVALVAGLLGLGIAATPITTFILAATVGLLRLSVAPVSADRTADPAQSTWGRVIAGFTLAVTWFMLMALSLTLASWVLDQNWVVPALVDEWILVTAVAAHTVWARRSETLAWRSYLALRRTTIVLIAGNAILSTAWLLAAVRPSLFA